LGGDAAKQNSSSPAGVLKDQVPAYITGLFEERLAGKGFGLRELAILASTIEHMIHNEAVSRLGAVFDVLKLSVTSPISNDEASEVLDTYMMAYILGENLSDMTLAKARLLNKAMPEVFLAWKQTQKFVDDVRRRSSRMEQRVWSLHPWRK
jgi:predicted SAM-dependent methyltransferase